MSEDVITMRLRNTRDLLSALKGAARGDWSVPIYIAQKNIDDLLDERTKFPVSSTLDRLLDSRFDLAAEAEADLGEILHKGEKVMVKIKVVRGE